MSKNKDLYSAWNKAVEKLDEEAPFKSYMAFVRMVSGCSEEEVRDYCKNRINPEPEYQTLYTASGVTFGPTILSVDNWKVEK